MQPTDDTKPIIKSVKQKGKSRLQEYLDQQNQDGGNMTGANVGYDDEEFDSGDGTARKAVKRRHKQNI